MQSSKVLFIMALISMLSLGLSSITWSGRLAYPVDVAVDIRGSIFVADHEAHALLQFKNNQFVVLAKGKGLPRTPLYGIRHITTDREGGVVASDPATMKLYRINAVGSIDAIPDDDQFITPWGVAMEMSGDILAVDRVTHRLRRLKAGGIVEEIANIRSPRTILFDKEGNIIILTDRNLERVEGETTTPLISSSPFEFPHDAVLHPNGNYYVTDGYAKTIWQVTSEGDVSAFVQAGQLMSPQGLALDGNGNLLVADAHARTIFVITTKAELTELGKN